MEHTIIHLSKSDNQDKWKATTTYLDDNFKPECGFEGHMNVQDLVKSIDECVNKGCTVEIRCSL